MQIKRKKATLITLFLMFAMAFSLMAVPFVHALDGVMNLPGDEGRLHYALIHEPNYDINFDNPTTPHANTTLWVKYPGRTDFTYIGGWPTGLSDFHYYGFDFNETGDFQLKWVVFDPAYDQSNTETVRVVATAGALPGENYPSFVYVAVAPSPVGVGQPVTIVVWPAEIPPVTPYDDTLGSVGNRQAWTGWTLTVTKPTGGTDTITLPASDPVGGSFYTYTPTEVGEYSVQSHFPAQWKNTTSYRRLYAAADSAVETFTVQEEPLTPIPGVPLPTDYWTRPINSYNREWYTISQNWITGIDDERASYIDTPDSAHILWTEPYYFGGIAGGAKGTLSYHTGSAYENKMGGTTIISGMLFYNLNLADSTTTTKANIIARDLRTGELIWQVNQSAIGASTIYEYESPNQHGVHPYLWTSGSSALTLSPGAAVPSNTIVDPFQGTELFRFINVPSGTATIGPEGQRWIYRWGGPSSNRTWLALWDSFYSPALTGLAQSQWDDYLADPDAFVETTSFWQWRPVGKIIDGDLGYRWNITLPPNLGTSYQVYAFSDRLISGTGFAQFGTSQYHETYEVWAISLEEGTRGNLMWKIHPKATVANETLQWSGASAEDGILVLRAKETRKFLAFNLDTGASLWTTESQPQWMMYSSGVTFYNGKMYSAGYGGQVFCYDLENGNLLWTSDVDLEGLESAYGRSPLSMQVYDGKVFVRSQEHSHTHPLYRTWKIYAFDAETGDRLWDLHGLWNSFAFSDGIGVSLNSDDQLIYAIGKGPSATTITASPKVFVHGDSVMLEGSVMDVSAGTQNDRISLRFPNGVPAVSDASMTPWMEYVYMQMPKPDTTGVEVVLSVIDPNNNFYEIGNTTTDINGNYGLKFTPEVPGDYHIFATFKGSASYGSSSASAYLSAEEAPQATPAPTPPPPSMADIYFVPGIIGVIIAIVAVGLVMVLMLRKR